MDIIYLDNCKPWKSTQRCFRNILLGNTRFHNTVRHSGVSVCWACWQFHFVSKNDRTLHSLSWGMYVRYNIVFMCQVLEIPFNLAPRYDFSKSLNWLRTTFGFIALQVDTDAFGRYLCKKRLLRLRHIPSVCRWAYWQFRIVSTKVEAFTLWIDVRCGINVSRFGNRKFDFSNR